MRAPPARRIKLIISAAWIEGTAIFIAAIVVVGVGSFVDYRKEVQFVKSRLKSDEKLIVSPLFSCRPQ